MVIKLKEGCLVELNNIKMAKVVYDGFSEIYNIEISYFDQNKNSKEYITCESREECNQLVDKLLSEINNSNTIKFM